MFIAGDLLRVMNLYPYNPGHLLVCPYRHVSGYGVDRGGDG